MKYTSKKIVGLSYYVKDSCFYIVNGERSRLHLKILNGEVSIYNTDDVLFTVESIKYKHLPIFTKINIIGKYDSIFSYSDCSYITTDNADVYNITLSNKRYMTRLYLNNSRVRNIYSEYDIEIHSGNMDNMVDCNSDLSISMAYHTLGYVSCKGELYIRSIMTIHTLYSIKPLIKRYFASHTNIKLCNHYVKFLTDEQYFIVGDDYYITKLNMKDKLYYMDTNRIINYLLKSLI